MPTPTREEIKAIRSRATEQAPNNFAALLNPEAKSEPVVETPTKPATPSVTLVPPVTPPQQNGAVVEDLESLELPDTASPKAGENFKKLKSGYAEQKKELQATKKELEEARQKLNEAIKTGTPQEEAIAREEYEALQKEKAEYQSKLANYEAELKAERERREKYEQDLQQTQGKLAKLSLDFDPDFQERYVKPLEDIQVKLTKKIKGMSDSDEVASQVSSLIYTAVQQGDEQAFYASLRRIKEADPENYGLYVGDVQNMRDLLLARLQAMENHEKTAQTLRAESYRTRERTAPESIRRLTEARQEIETREHELNAYLESEAYVKFLRSQNLDPQVVDAKLEEAVRNSHTTGELNKELLYYAAEGARKMKLQPGMAFMKSQLDQVTKELEEAKKQLEDLRGSQTVRQLNGAPSPFQPLQPPVPQHTAKDIRRMGSEQRLNAIRQNIQLGT